jgi:hypothetical protein
MASKIKSKVVKATLANKDVLDMFHGVLGTAGGGAMLCVVHPKYLRMQEHVGRFLRVLGLLAASRPLALHPGPRQHLENYVAALRAQSAASFSAQDLGPWLAAAGAPEVTLAPPADRYAAVPAEVAAAFSEVFAATKKCSVVNTVVVACKNLIVHKKALADPAALKGRFLLAGGGLSFAPLPDLPQLNFRQLYIDDRLAAGDKELLLLVLHKLLTIGHDLYETVSSPDVDVSEFVEVVMGSVGEVKKHIPRCEQAFQKIIESVDLLKGNFDGYYKDYTASGNPTIIMENFVLDVSKNTKSSPAVTAQFRRIISHYRKLASQQATNPKLQSLFAQVDANFQELERRSKDADGDGSDSDGSDSDGGSGGGGGGGGDGKEGTPPAEQKAPGANAARNRRKRAKARAKGRPDAAPQRAQPPVGPPEPESAAAPAQPPAAPSETPAQSPETPAQSPEAPAE